MQAFIVARTVLGLVAAIIETIVLIAFGRAVGAAMGRPVIPDELRARTSAFIVALIPPTVLALALYGPCGCARRGHRLQHDQHRRGLRAPAALHRLERQHVGAVVTLSIVFWSLVLGPAPAPCSPFR